MSAAAFNRVAFMALLTGAVGIAFAPVFVRLSQTGPSATAFYRLFLALPFFWSWQFWERSKAGESRQPQSPKEYGLLAVSGLCFTADLALWHWSIKLTSVANATLFANFAPIFVTLGAWALLHERITARFLAGMVMALAGAVVLLWNSSAHLSRDHLAGDLLGIGTAIFYGAYMLTVKQLRQRFSAVTVMAWSGVAASAGLFLVAVASGETMLPETGRGWLVLIALAVVSQVGGQTLIAYGFGHLPASFSSLSLLLQPAVAALLAWVILHEPVGWRQALGGVIILTGIITAKEN